MTEENRVPFRQWWIVRVTMPVGLYVLFLLPVMIAIDSVVSFYRDPLESLPLDGYLWLAIGFYLPYRLARWSWSKKLHGRWYWFDGRIPRSTFWDCTIGLFVTGLVIGPLYVFGFAPIIYILSIAVLTYLWLIVNIKRWHDRNKSAWWVLISCIPLVGPIWVLVELGCLAGTDGDNRYGKDPRRQYNLMAHHRASPSN